MQPRQYIFNNSTLTIILGNIVESKAEVIASSDDTLITMGGGVSASIRRAGGIEIQADARRKIPAMLGDVIVSTAGNLHKQKFVFHCLTIDRNSTLFGNKYIANNQLKKEDLNKYIIRHSVNKCFQLLQILELSSIAFPTIGAGAADIPLEEVTTIMADVISENLSKTNKKYNIELYLYDRYNTRSEMDYISIFENFAVKSALAKLQKEDEMSLYVTENVESTNNKLDNIPVRSNMHHDIFISYSRMDSDKVKSIQDYLDEKGFKYWIDKNGIYSGENYKDVIVDAIETSKVVLFMSSEHSNSSLNVIRELSYATYTKRIIIPILLDDSPYARSIRLDIADVDQLIWGGDLNYSKNKLETSLLYSLNNEQP